MRVVGKSLLAALLLVPAGGLAQEPTQQVAWARDLNPTLARARTENRPILIAINALDNEGGNNFMAHTGYREPSLVAATRPLACLIANPNDHRRSGDTCPRYGATDCKTHRDVLTYALRRWSNQGDIISPQHAILAPDGTLLWRQEYVIQPNALQAQCEKAVVRTAPKLALELATQTRAAATKTLMSGTDPKAYLKLGDPLAPAVLLLLWEEDEDAKWLDALKQAPPSAFGLVRLYIEEDDAFLAVAKAIDAKKGAWWQKRLKGRPAKAPPPHDAKLRKAFGALKRGDKSGLDALLAALEHPVDGPEVRAALAELAGMDHGPAPDGWREHFSR